MRSTVLISALVLSCLLVAAAKDKPLADMIREADAADVKDQPKLYIKISQQQLRDADKLFSAGNSEPARAAVENVVLYSGKATDAAVQSGSRLKKTEIDIRKMADKLRDIKRNLNYDDQPLAQSAMDKLQDMRSKLLARMFEKKKP